VITPRDESVIQLDNLEIAQFIYLLLNNEKIRDMIDTLGKKAVLILGRFTTERKEVLDAIRAATSTTISGFSPDLGDPAGRFSRPGRIRKRNLQNVRKQGSTP
jgi:hypothetical protein